jgi:hypothetical protein
LRSRSAPASCSGLAAAVDAELTQGSLHDDKLVVAASPLRPPPEHRQKCPEVSLVVLPRFAVARKVPRGEWETRECQVAIVEEVKEQLTAPWPKCKTRNPTGKGVGAWDNWTVQEGHQLLDWSRTNGITVHIARACLLLYEKGVRAAQGPRGP